MPRTQSEFDNSFTLKLYLLQFVNNYSSIFYITFIRSVVLGEPGRFADRFGHRGDHCNIFGCMSEVSLQMLIIMVGKQILRKSIYLATPSVLRLWRRVRPKPPPDRDSRLYTGTEQRMLSDLRLLEWNPLTLFDEYLEMVIQFGFVTLFAAALPLAPLFAFINNLLELRWDATMIMRDYRRPVAAPTNSIGVWRFIMNAVVQISVMTNACMLAFTSDYVPRFVYKHYHSKDGTLRGYVGSILQEFAVSELRTPATNETVCYFAVQRYPPVLVQPKRNRDQYWRLLAYRFLFVLLFRTVVSLMSMVLEWAIPPKSQRLELQEKREAYYISETILEHERQNMRNRKCCGDV